MENWIPIKLKIFLNSVSITLKTLTYNYLKNLIKQSVNLISSSLSKLWHVESINITLFIYSFRYFDYFSSKPRIISYHFIFVLFFFSFCLQIFILSMTPKFYFLIVCVFSRVSGCLILRNSVFFSSREKGSDIIKICGKNISNINSFKKIYICWT